MSQSPTIKGIFVNSHIKNFSATPLGRIIFSVFRSDFKTVMLKAANIAGHVFRGVVFSSDARGPRHMVITMAHADYPILRGSEYG